MTDSKVVALAKTKTSSSTVTPEPGGKFNVGDTVSLASGGCLMTVRQANKRAVIVDWINAAGDLCTAEFMATMLRYGELEVEVEMEDDA
jgi:uncharacterized protein YodC (DUF2158 family)